jgi:tetratricopeptide (TPR) repeat protein
LALGLCLVALVTPADAAEPGRNATQGSASQQTDDSVAANLSGAEIAIAESLLNRVEAHWWRRVALLQRGETEAAAKATRDLLELLEREDVQRLPELAAAAVVEAEQARGARNLTGALEAYRLARKLDPGQAEAAWGEASLLLGDGRYGQALGPAMASIRARWTDFWNLYGDVTGLLAWLGAALWLSGAAVMAALLIRYGPTLAAAVSDRMPARWHRSLRTSLGWGVVLAPALVIVLGAWVLVVWAVTLVPALRRPERRFVLCWLLLTALLVPGMGLTWLLTSAGASPEARVAVATAERSPRPNLLLELAELADEDPDEPAWRVMLARLVGEQHPDRAMRLLRDAQQAAPTDPRVRIAFGNVLFRAGKYEAAAVRYREALEIDQDHALALFNLGRAYLAGFQFDEANRVLLEARRRAPDRVTHLEQTLPEEEVADPTFSVGEVSRRVLGDEIGPGLRRALRPVNPLSGVALAALLAAWLLGVRGGRIPVRRCRTCGQSIRSAVDEAERKDVCRACDQLFAGREGLAPGAREEQRRRVDRYLRRITRARTIVHLLWPGLALAHEGRTWAGWIMATLWLFGLTGWLWSGALLPPALGHGPWPSGLPLLVFAGLVWVAAQLVPSLRPAPAGQRPRGR